jgi:cellulose biosynthesis protein BcsQ
MNTIILNQVDIAFLLPISLLILFVGAFERRKTSGETKIGASHSTRGGTGKTTYTLIWGWHLNCLGYKVLVIDADIYHPSWTSLNIERPEDKPGIHKKYLNDHFWRNARIEECICHTKFPNLDVIFANPRPVFENELRILEFGPSELSKMTTEERMEAIKTKSAPVNAISSMENSLRNAKPPRRYDWILFDNKPGYDQIALQPVTQADVILFSLNPDHIGFDSSDHLLEQLYKPEEGYILESMIRVGLIFNRVGPTGISQATLNNLETVLEKNRISKTVQEEIIDTLSADANIKIDELNKEIDNWQGILRRHNYIKEYVRIPCHCSLGTKNPTDFLRPDEDGNPTLLVKMVTDLVDRLIGTK